MFDLFKNGRINKISATHSELISDALILMNIVNSQDAKKNLDSEQFKEYLDTFTTISKRKEEYPTNSLQYEHRAFSIAYEFEYQAEVPYEKICGDATDILYMYSNMKPKFDELLDDVLYRYIDIIEGIIREKEVSEAEEFKIFSYASSYFLMVTTNILQANRMIGVDFFTSFLYEMAFRKFVERVSLDYVNSEQAKQEFRDYRNLMDKMHKEAYDNNDTIDGYIETFTNSLLYLCGVSEDTRHKSMLIQMAQELLSITPDKKRFNVTE